MLATLSCPSVTICFTNISATRVDVSHNIATKHSPIIVKGCDPANVEHQVAALIDIAP